MLIKVNILNREEDSGTSAEKRGTNHFLKKFIFRLLYFLFELAIKSYLASCPFLSEYCAARIPFRCFSIYQSWHLPFAYRLRSLCAHFVANLPLGSFQQHWIQSFLAQCGRLKCPHAKFFSVFRQLEPFCFSRISKLGSRISRVAKDSEFGALKSIFGKVRSYSKS